MTLTVRDLKEMIKGFDDEDGVFCWCEDDSTINGFKPRYKVLAVEKKIGEFVGCCNGFKEDESGKKMAAIKITDR